MPALGGSGLLSPAYHVNDMVQTLTTRLGGISQNFGQGSFQSTSNVTDMAVSGQGFFTQVRSSSSNLRRSSAISLACVCSAATAIVW